MNGRSLRVKLPFRCPQMPSNNNSTGASSGFQPNQGKNTKAVVKIVSYKRCLQSISVRHCKNPFMLWIFFTNFVADFVKFLRIPTFSLIKTDFFYIFSLSVNGKLSLLRYMASKLFFETTFIIKTFKSV